MHQTQLFSAENVAISQINTPSVSAWIQEVQDETYEVTLNISSNKFLILIKERSGIIESFEILAVKSFVGLTQKTVKLLRKVVEQLLQKKYAI